MQKAKEKYTKKRGEETYILVPAWVVCNAVTRVEKLQQNRIQNWMEHRLTAYDYEAKDLDLKTLFD